MPKIEVNINQLKWNLAWVIMAIKVFLMQNLSLIALLVLETWRHKISLGRREQVMKFGYLPPENGFNFKKMSFYVQNRSSRPKIDPPCQFQQFSSIGKIFHFQNFWDVSMRKEQQQPPWLTNFAKIWPKGVSRIKTKSYQVWASLEGSLKVFVFHEETPLNFNRFQLTTFQGDDCFNVTWL